MAVLRMSGGDGSSSNSASGSGKQRERQEKRGKRQTQQERAGLHVSVSRCRRRIARKWKGNISADAAVILAAFLEYIDTTLITAAAAAAQADGATARITSAHVQMALTSTEWLRDRRLVRGRVLGAAPMTMNVVITGDVNDDDDNE